MTDAAGISLITTAGIIVVAWIQRNQNKKIEAIHEVAKVIKTDVNNNWKIASDRIDQLQMTLQEAGIKVPATPPPTPKG